MAWPAPGLFSREDVSSRAASSASPPKRTESAVVGAVRVRLMAGLLSLVTIVRLIREAAQGQAWRRDVVPVGELGVGAQVVGPTAAEVVPPGDGSAASPAPDGGRAVVPRRGRPAQILRPGRHAAVEAEGQRQVRARVPTRWSRRWLRAMRLRERGLGPVGPGSGARRFRARPSRPRAAAGSRRRTCPARRGSTRSRCCFATEAACCAVSLCRCGTTTSRGRTLTPTVATCTGKAPTANAVRVG